jgi:hypothetical protein
MSNMLLTIVATRFLSYTDLVSRILEKPAAHVEVERWIKIVFLSCQSYGQIIHRFPVSDAELGEDCGLLQPWAGLDACKF